MWNRTPFTQLLGIEYPIVQGAFGGSGSSIELTALVSSSGGLGSFGMQAMDGDQIRRTVRELRSRTSRPFAANLWMPKEDPPMPTGYLAERMLDAGLSVLRPYYEELGLAEPGLPGRLLPATPDLTDQLDAILEARPPVFSFIFGIPSERVIAICRERGIATIGTAASAAEAIALEQAGVDCVVASGHEAGGRKGSFMHPPEERMTGTFTLLPQVVGSVRIPVIAAGGIGDARGVAAALALGAHGVQIGAAFLACDESSIELDGPILPCPTQPWLIGTLMQAAVEHGRADLVALPAGRTVALAKRRSAGDLMGELVQGTPRVLAGLLARGTKQAEARSVIAQTHEGNEPCKKISNC